MADNFYEVALDYGGVAVDARVNDGPLWFKRSRVGGTFEIISNRWVRAGQNDFSLRLYPLTGETTFRSKFRCAVKIYERERGSPRESRREIAAASFAFGDLVTLKRLPDGGALARLDFTAHASLPEWAWLSGPRVSDSPATMSSLLQEIDSIHGLLMRKDAHSLGDRVRERDREIALAHFQSVEEQRAETLRDFERMLSDPDMPLEPRETEKLRLRLYGDQHLARVEDENGDSPIYFLSLDEKLVRFVPFTFCQRADQSWMIIR